jgi:arylsulfatase A-like enzyme
MPCVPPREYLERIPDSIIPDPIPEPDLFPAPVARRRNSTYPLAKYTLDQWRRARRYYLAYVLQIDDAVGRMLDLVDPRNTYVLFSADHGDMLGDHGLWEKGAWHYDACVRVPMFLSGSGVEPAEREDIVSNLDISTTVLNMAGVENAREGTLLKRNSRTDMFIESYGMCTPGFADLNSPDTWCFTLRSKEYRYSWYPYGRAEQYFDLVDDPDERNDLSGSPGHAEKIKTLRASLKERLYWLGGL